MTEVVDLFFYKGEKKMKNISFLISKYSIYIFLFSSLFLIERFILLHFFDLKSITIFGKMYFYEIVLSIVNIIILFKFVRISGIK